MPPRPPWQAPEPVLAGVKVQEPAQAAGQVRQSVQVQVPQEPEQEPQVSQVPEPVQVSRELVPQEPGPVQEQVPPEPEPVEWQVQELAQPQELELRELQRLVRRPERVLSQLELQGPEQASALAQGSEALSVKQVQRPESRPGLLCRPSRNGVRVRLRAGVAFRRQVEAGRMRVLLEPERERAARPGRLLELRVLAFFS